MNSNTQDLPLAERVDAALAFWDSADREGYSKQRIPNAAEDISASLEQGVKTLQKGDYARKFMSELIKNEINTRV